MNKSQLARDFWRKIFDNNVIDLRNSDARNKAVTDFLENPANKKTWAKKDRRYFRLGFDFICRERGFNSHKVGVKPIPQKTQTNTGSISMNVKTDEKKVHTEKPLHDITSKQLKETGQEATAQQIPQAAHFASENIGTVFDTMFNILHARYPECDKLSIDEKRSLGEAFLPIFDKYLGDKGGIWVMPILILIPIVLQRAAQMNTAKKERELKEEYFPDKQNDDNKDKKDFTSHFGK